MATENWGPNPALTAAATPCTQRLSKDLEPPDDKKGSAATAATQTKALLDAFHADQFASVYAMCEAHPPTDVSTLYPCMVSACEAKRPGRAVLWSDHTSQADINQKVRALNECLRLGFDMTKIAEQVHTKEIKQKEKRQEKQEKRQRRGGF